MHYKKLDLSLDADCLLVTYPLILTMLSLLNIKSKNDYVRHYYDF